MLKNGHIVEYLHKFLTQNKEAGSYGEEVGIQYIEKGVRYI